MMSAVGVVVEMAKGHPGDDRDGMRPGRVGACVRVRVYEGRRGVRCHARWMTHHRRGGDSSGEARLETEHKAADLSVGVGL